LNHEVSAHSDRGKCFIFHNLFRLAGSESSTVSQRLAAYWSHIVRMAMVIGTPMNAPGIPQRKLQKNTANSTRNGEIARVAPAIRGSRKLPIVNWMTLSPARTIHVI